MINADNPYAGMKVAVLGLGRSGVAAARLLRRCGASVTAIDSGSSQLLSERAELLRGEGLSVVTGAESLCLDECQDLAVLSPGIEESAPIVTNVTSRGTPLVGELELAFSLTSSPVVAITGTNGKTTTTELTARMLRGAGIRAEASGNIGVPMSELLLGDEPELHVVEVSSFQLETIRSFRPNVALWLNLSPNHLDRYPSMAEYREAKLRIFMNQTGEDWAVVRHGSDLPPLKARTVTFSTTDPSADLTLEEETRIMHRGFPLLDMGATRLRGPHNAANLMAAFGAGIALGADVRAMAASLGEYAPPAHRCEPVAERGGVRWINDSKATNLDAMEQAIRSVNGPLILIAGGKDKGFGFAPIAPLVKEKASLAVLIGEMRHRIARDWAPVPAVVAGTLEEAVEAAAGAARPGDTVLFSPGTSSFDMFRDYVRRGEEFRRLVLALPDSPQTR
jgi:UDP-N-acetylmuramoylalanine--D-glutamate ligase